MSVPNGKRSESKMEFLHNALKLRKELVVLLLRDFGVKSKVWDVHLLEESYNMKEPDRTEFETILDDYGIETNILFEFPQWMIEKLRDNICDNANELVKNIIKANSIFPVNEVEGNERRIYQDRAIAHCFVLLEELQFVTDILPVDKEKYMRYVEMINYEISLLKGWRKYTSKIVERLKKDD